MGAATAARNWCTSGEYLFTAALLSTAHQACSAEPKAVTEKCQHTKANIRKRLPLLIKQARLPTALHACGAAKGRRRKLWTQPGDYTEKPARPRHYLPAWSSPSSHSHATSCPKSKFATGRWFTSTRARSASRASHSGNDKPRRNRANTVIGLRSLPFLQ